jgi:hypothetical protein
MPSKQTEANTLESSILGLASGNQERLAVCINLVREGRIYIVIVASQSGGLLSFTQLVRLY